MAGSMAVSYWCHMCRQRVIPIMELELKCPFCESGFVEEIAGREVTESWLSILDGMMSYPSRHQRSRRFPIAEDDDDSDFESELEFILGRRLQETDEHVWRARLEEGDEESDTEHQLESTAQRRQSSALLELLYSLRDDLRPESDEHEMESEMESERASESMVLINSFNEAVVLDGPFNTDQNPSHDSEGAAIGASIGDYFVGSGLEMLLQHLSENDPNCYGTPPAQKGAVDALPVVKIAENINCPVCLEDFEFGMQARQMPCFSYLLMNQRLRVGQQLLRVGKGELVVIAVLEEGGIDPGLLPRGPSMECFKVRSHGNGDSLLTWLHSSSESNHIPFTYEVRRCFINTQFLQPLP